MPSPENFSAVRKPAPGTRRRGAGNLGAERRDGPHETMTLLQKIITELTSRWQTLRNEVGYDADPGPKARLRALGETIAQLQRGELSFGWENQTIIIKGLESLDGSVLDGLVRAAADGYKLHRNAAIHWLDGCYAVLSNAQSNPRVKFVNLTPRGQALKIIEGPRGPFALPASNGLGHWIAIRGPAFERWYTNYQRQQTMAQQARDAEFQASRAKLAEIAPALDAYFDRLGKTDPGAWVCPKTQIAAAAKRLLEQYRLYKRCGAIKVDSDSMKLVLADMSQHPEVWR